MATLPVPMTMVLTPLRLQQRQVTPIIPTTTVLTLVVRLQKQVIHSILMTMVLTPIRLQQRQVTPIIPTTTVLTHIEQQQRRIVCGMTLNSLP
jgi:hypothetical protein